MSKSAPPAKSQDTDLIDPPAPLPPIVESLLPVGNSTEIAETGLDACALPSDEDFTDGIFYLGDEPYALCIHEADGYGNTHSLKNTKRTWQGTAVQFNETFTRK